jgi:hypothetical protein
MPASFVYQKRSKIREGADICEQKCKRLACEIQVCISRLPVNKSRVSASTIDHSRCQPDIDRYNRCCELRQEGAGDAEAKSALSSVKPNDDA